MASKYNIKVQYAAWMVTVTLATVVLMTTVHLWREADDQEKTTQRRAEIAAQTLANSITAAMVTNDVNTMARAVQAMDSRVPDARRSALCAPRPMQS